MIIKGTPQALVDVLFERCDRHGKHNEERYRDIFLLTFRTFTQPIRFEHAGVYAGVCLCLCLCLCVCLSVSVLNFHPTPAAEITPPPSPFVDLSPLVNTNL